MASEVVKENVEIAPPSPYANNDTFDTTNDEFNDDYNEDVTDEVLEEKDDLVQINVEDIKGQLISKCLLGVINSTKIPTKLFYGFLP